jgi:hypothetical protein
MYLLLAGVIIVLLLLVICGNKDNYATLAGSYPVWKAEENYLCNLDQVEFCVMKDGSEGTCNSGMCMSPN